MLVFLQECKHCGEAQVPTGVTFDETEVRRVCGYLMRQIYNWFYKGVKPHLSSGIPFIRNKKAKSHMKGHCLAC